MASLRTQEIRGEAAAHVSGANPELREALLERQIRISERQEAGGISSKLKKGAEVSVRVLSWGAEAILHEVPFGDAISSLGRSIYNIAKHVEENDSVSVVFKKRIERILETVDVRVTLPFSVLFDFPSFLDLMTCTSIPYHLPPIPAQLRYSARASSRQRQELSRLSSIYSGTHTRDSANGAKRASRRSCILGLRRSTRTFSRASSTRWTSAWGS